MTPQQLADQQLWTAWISAGAAAVQAIGAVAAILASIVLARSSEKRAAKAERDAIAREADAEAASIRRARAAEDRAEMRERERTAHTKNTVIDIAIAMAEITLKELQEAIDNLRPAATAGGMYGGGFRGARAPEARARVLGLASQSTDPGVTSTLVDLAQAMETWGSPSINMPGPEYLAVHEDQATRIRAHVDQLRQLKL